MDTKPQASHRQKTTLCCLLLFLLALLLLISRSRPVPASMTIRAVASTGDTWYQPPQPIWEFAITNSGPSTVVWYSNVEVRDGNDRDYSHAGGHIQWPKGILAPGQGVLTNMIVPAKTGSVWRASLDFWPVSAEALKKAEDLAKDNKAVTAINFCPYPKKKRETNDVWHP